MIKRIHKPNEFGARLGIQRPEPGITYVENPCLVKEGNAWYNPMTGEAIYVDDQKSEIKRLIQRWYMVPSGCDIKALTHMVRQKTLADTTPMGNSSKNSYVIFTTTACNAHCEYCFEKDYKIITMTDEIALDVAKYITSTRNRNRTPNIKWFGGEPLINKRAIDIICNHLNRNMVPFRGDITTNGVLLDTLSDDTIVDKWHLKNVQVTLDDVGVAYGTHKGLGDDAYTHLKSQIERLSALGVHVAVRVHYHPDLGLDPCKRVIDDLKSISNLSMYARIIYHTATQADYEKLLELEDYMYDAGVFRHQFPGRGGGVHCMGDNRRVACITPEGLLSPCEHYAYGETYGSIYSNKVDTEMLAEWKVREKHMCDCGDCKLYPCCEKIMMCPAEGECQNGYMYYQIETIKRALKREAKQNGETIIKGASEEDLKVMCGIC